MANALPVCIPRRYESRYSLLGAMADELAAAFADAGHPVVDSLAGDRPGLFVFFNMPQSVEGLPPAVRRPGSPIAAIQVLVDHPLALDPRIMDVTSRWPNFRLVLPSVDGLHLLRLRWPGLTHGHVPHGIPPGALIDPAELGEATHAARDFDVVVAGSIHTQRELMALRATLPAQAQGWVDEIVALMAAEPLMPFEQAIDLVMGGRGVVTGAWPTMAAVWRVTSAELNRARRLAMLRELDGLRVGVFGGEAWAEHCSGTVVYGGGCAYADLPRVLARGRACLAWGPTQFEHTFSERLLLSMAAGCASVADDRYMIGRHFAFDGDDAAVRVFDSRTPGACRDAFDTLLADGDGLLRLARSGRDAAEAGHLWSHRLETIVAIGAEAIERSAAPRIRQSA